MVLRSDGTVDSIDSFTATKFQNERQAYPEARRYTVGFATASSPLVLWRAVPVSDG